jgi:hypothetical protein
LKEWLVSCVSLKLKDWEEKALELQGLYHSTDNSEVTMAMLSTIQPAWTIKGFTNQLVKWIVVDDQASDVL